MRLLIQALIWLLYVYSYAWKEKIILMLHLYFIWYLTGISYIKIYLCEFCSSLRYSVIHLKSLELASSEKIYSCQHLVCVRECIWRKMTNFSHYDSLSSEESIFCNQVLEYDHKCLWIPSSFSKTKQNKTKHSGFLLRQFMLRFYIH